jgi:hypothetical protein
MHEYVRLGVCLAVKYVCVCLCLSVCVCSTVFYVVSAGSRARALFRALSNHWRGKAWWPRLSVCLKSACLSSSLSLSFSLSLSLSLSQFLLIVKKISLSLSRSLKISLSLSLSRASARVSLPSVTQSLVDGQ